MSSWILLARTSVLKPSMHFTLEINSPGYPIAGMGEIDEGQTVLDRQPLKLVRQEAPSPVLGRIFFIPARPAQVVLLSAEDLIIDQIA
jgi:hypothetical protein